MEKPVGYESVLSDFKACVFDGYCGEPVAWGFEILEKLGEERWEALKVHGQLQCLYPKWFLIMHELSRAEAISKYVLWVVGSRQHLVANNLFSKVFNHLLKNQMKPKEHLPPFFFRRKPRQEKVETISRFLSD